MNSGAPSGRVQKWREWYKHPDREILRREANWALQWFRKPAGLLWVGFYIAALIFEMLLVRFRGAIYVPYIGYVGYFRVFVLWILWATLIQKRALKPLQKERFRDIYLTRLDKGALWPGLLAGPIIVTASFSILNLVFTALTFAFTDTYSAIFSQQLGDLSENPYLFGLFYASYWIYPAFGAIASFLRGSATTALVARIVPPTSGMFRILVVIGSVRWSLYLLVELLIDPIFMLRSASTAHSVNLYPLLTRTLIPMLTSLASILIYLVCLKSLRSAKKWEQLRVLTERP